MTGPASPHRRQNLLTGDWVLVSPQRTERPWQGQVETASADAGVAYDPGCYLCPGNRRAGGTANPEYDGPYAFDNDYPALKADAGGEFTNHPLLRAEAESGCCRVVCFSGRHDRHLVHMTVPESAAVLRFIAAECRALGGRDDIAYVQVFENRGAMMGASNPHPHGQIWATSSIPDEVRRELDRQREYYAASGRRLLSDYLEVEIERAERIVASNVHAVSLVPYWATWPFETLLVPRTPAATLDALSDEALHGFAAILKTTLEAYDRLFAAAMPYSMGYHPRPCDGDAHPEWQLHAHFYPPLLRSATVRKHMVGFEMLAMPQRDLTPEVAAERLRAALD